MIDVNCDGKSDCAREWLKSRNAHTHTAGALCFRFQFDFRHNSLPDFRRFYVVLCVCVAASTTTTMATIKVFQFMNVQQFRNTHGNDTIRFVRASEQWNKREHEGKKTHSDGIIFITISCYQVKEHPLTLVSFDIANDLCAHDGSGETRRCGEMRSYLRLFFFRIRLLLLCGISIHFAMTRDG